MMSENPGAPLLLIVNRSAGGGRALRTLERASKALDRLRLPFRIEPSTSPEHASELAAMAVETGETPVAVGGDGQVANVAQPLVGGNAAMGILPGGRGNDFARGLGIPTDPEEAVLNLASAPVIRIDVGQANGKRFLGIASVGFDSRANEIANRSVHLPGGMVYAWAAARALIGWKPVRFSLTVDGRTSRVEAHTIAVANNRFYGAGMEMAPGAVLDDGLLELVVVGSVSRLRFLADFPKVFRGRHVDGERVTEHPVREVTIDAGRPLVVYADGDPLTSLPARVRALRGALGVIAGVESGG